MTTLTIQIQYEERAIGTIRWQAFDEDHEQTAVGDGSLEELSSFVESLSSDIKEELMVIALLPDKETLYVRTRIPGGNRNRIRRAAPYSIEQYLTEDIDSMHVAIGEFGKGELIPVAAYEDSLFAQTLEALREAGIEPNVVSTIGLMANANPNEVVVLLENGSAVIRTYEQMAQVDMDVLPELLPSLLSNYDEEDDLQIRFVTNSATTEAFDTWSQSLSYAESKVIKLSPTEYVVREFEEDSTFNLLQGDYERTDIYAVTRSKWGEVASVSMVCLVVTSIVLGVEGYWAEHNSDLLRDSANELYERIFDEPNPFGNPATKMQARMGLAMGSAEGFGRLLTIVAGSSSSDELTNLWYRDAEQELSASFRIRNYERLDAIKEKMEQGGSIVAIRTAEQREDVVIANLELRLP